jgi:hypothetical protein
MVLFNKLCHSSNNSAAQQGLRRIVDVVTLTQRSKYTEEPPRTKRLGPFSSDAEHQPPIVLVAVASKAGQLRWHRTHRQQHNADKKRTAVHSKVQPHN